VSEPIAWVRGALVPVSAASVSVLDRGFRAGEGIFETLRAYGDHLFRLSAHVRRAQAGAEALGFVLDAEELAAALRATATANLARLGGEDSAVRLTASAGSIEPDGPFPGVAVGEPTIVVTSHRLAIDAEVERRGVAARTGASIRGLPQVKSLSYGATLAAQRAARAAGAHEALLTAPDGQVVEGATSNLFAVIDDRLVTPPLDAGLLEGVTRGVVLELAAALGIEVELRPLHREELLGAAEAFLTASVREVVPLVEVDGVTIGGGQPGPWTRSLHRAYRDEVERERR
jgi:branched-chain amino acid aminotransferase